MRVYRVVIITVALMLSPTAFLVACLPAAHHVVTIPRVEATPLDQRSRTYLGEVDFLSPEGPTHDQLYVCGYPYSVPDAGFSCIEYKEFMDNLKSLEDEVKSKYPTPPTADPKGLAL